MKNIMNTLIATCLLAGCLSTQPSSNTTQEAQAVQPVKVKESLQEDPETVAEPFDFCPPLPKISPAASRFEGRLWTLTVVALYEQCAGSKK